jgi:hypothetical protein
LARTIKEGNRVFQAVRNAEHPWQSALFPEMRVVLNKTIETFQIRLDKALNPTVQRGIDIRYATVADALELPRLQLVIAGLRRLHIDSLSPATEPTEAVAVPA